MASSIPDYLPKAPPPNNHPAEGQVFNVGIWRGHTHWVHNTIPDRLFSKQVSLISGITYSSQELPNKKRISSSKDLCH